MAEFAAQRRTDPAQLPKLLDGELDWITMKALDKDRTRRYETVNSLTRDLERYLTGEPVEFAPPSTAYRLGKFVRRHRVWLATAVTFTVLLATGVVVITLMAVRASRAEQEARAVNDFLQNDLLAQASANKQSSPNTKPDPDLKVRTALDRAATRVDTPRTRLTSASMYSRVTRIFSWKTFSAQRSGRVKCCRVGSSAPPAPSVTLCPAE